MKGSTALWPKKEIETGTFFPMPRGGGRVLLVICKKRKIPKKKNPQ